MMFMVYLNMTFSNLPVSLLAIKIENRLIFEEVMGNSLVSCFFDSRNIYDR